jgi:c-di-GMP-binding flagellar brake protein YcgR
MPAVSQPPASPTRKPFSWKRPTVIDRRPVLRLTAGGRRWDVRLVGMTHRARFLVGHPMDDGKLVFVKEGERFDVANFDGAVISAFESTVQRVLLGESTALEMSLPPTAQRKREVIRRARRAGVSLPCSVRYGESADQLRAGFVGDLSDLGAQVAIEYPLPSSVETVDLSLRITQFGEPHTVQVRANLRSSAPDPRPEMPATLLGLQFVDVDPTVRLTLACYVAERLLAQADDVFGAIGGAPA